LGQMGVKRRIVRAGGWGLVKRLIKPVPVIGSIFALVWRLMKSERKV